MNNKVKTFVGKHRVGTEAVVFIIGETIVTMACALIGYGGTLGLLKICDKINKISEKED